MVGPAISCEWEEESIIDTQIPQGVMRKKVEMMMMKKQKVAKPKGETRIEPARRFLYAEMV